MFHQNLAFCGSINRHCHFSNARLSYCEQFHENARLPYSTASRGGGKGCKGRAAMARARPRAETRKAKANPHDHADWL
jgi:hypothetical protein